MALANSGPARADSRVYRWLDGEGNVHITATPPPPGAVPAPDPPPRAAPPVPRDRLQVVPETGAAPAPPQPEPAPPPSVPPAAAAAAPDADPCAKFAKEIAAWLDARRKVARIQAEIERIDDSSVQASATEHCPAYGYCTTETFVRDEALRRANEDLGRAEERAADAEEQAHRAGAPDRCLIDPTE